MAVQGFMWYGFRLRRSNGVHPLRLLLAGLLNGREAGKRSDRKLREARAADAVGSKGGTERHPQPERRRRGQEIGFKFFGRAHLDN